MSTAFATTVIALKKVVKLTTAPTTMPTTMTMIFAKNGDDDCRSYATNVMCYGYLIH